MTYATVCSGIEAPSVAWHPLGFDPVFFSEIEKFPSKVLAHHYPGVPNLGDMTKIDGTKYAGSIDLICGGTPCQSFSVSGLRKGMADPRGNLALVFLRLVDQIRPKWVVWENVPGVLSTNGGKDFGAFVGALGELGYGWAMRILDAQYFGVPQRRRRVFVVAHLGDWRPAAAVLFERESLRWDFKPRKEAGQSFAALTANGVGTCGADDNQAQAGHLVIDFRNHTVSETCQTLTANGNGPSANNTPYVMATGQANAEILAGQSPALTCNHEEPIVFYNAQITSPQNGSKCEPGAPCPTIAKDSQLTVCVSQPRFVRNGRGEPSETASALTAHAGGTGKGDSQQCVANGTTVRRITPKEAERLQGFPDVKKYLYICEWKIKYANVGVKCTKSLKHALSAEKTELKSNVKFAENHLSQKFHPILKRVELNVHINLEERTLLIHNQKKLISSVIFVENQNMFHQHIKIEDFVHLVARISTIQEKIMLFGKEALHLNIKRFFHQKNGNCYAIRYGKGSIESVKDAMLCITEMENLMKYTTLQVMQNFQTLELKYQTLLCFVTNVINSYIQEKIPKTSLSYLNIEVSHGYTNIPGAKDGPRYKALGNSMAVPVMRWIGERIKLVNDIINQTDND